MTDEEMRRTMEFILEQQAQFAAIIQKLEEGFQRREEERARDQPRLKRLEESFLLLVQLAETTDARLDMLESRAESLETNTAAITATQARVDESFAALAAAQAHADERLSALIDIVREGRNGKG